MGKLGDIWDKALLNLGAGLGLGESVHSSLFPAESVLGYLIPLDTEEDFTDLQGARIFFEARRTRESGWEILYYKTFCGRDLPPLIGHYPKSIVLQYMPTRQAALDELRRLEKLASALCKNIGDVPAVDTASQHVNHISRIKIEEETAAPVVHTQKTNVIRGNFPVKTSQDISPQARKPHRQLQSYQK